jgi:hypothetical protein
MLKLLKSSIFYDYLLFSKTFWSKRQCCDTAAALLEWVGPQGSPLFFQALAGVGSRTSVYILTTLIYLY